MTVMALDERVTKGPLVSGRSSQKRSKTLSSRNFRLRFNGSASFRTEKWQKSTRLQKKRLHKVSHFYSHERLISGLADLGSFHFGDFTLASGKKSSLYVDLRLLISNPSLMQEAARAYARVLKSIECDRVAGIPYAALPIGAAVSLESGIPLIYNRKETKSHGLGKSMEGLWKVGERVVIIEDVITSGGSILKSVKQFRTAGLEVKDAVVFLDRQQGGVEFLESNDVRVHSILNLQEVQDLLTKTGNCVKVGMPEPSETEPVLGRESTSQISAAW